MSDIRKWFKKTDGSASRAQKEMPQDVVQEIAPTKPVRKEKKQAKKSVEKQPDKTPTKKEEQAHVKVGPDAMRVSSPALKRGSHGRASNKRRIILDDDDDDEDRDDEDYKAVIGKEKDESEDELGDEDDDDKKAIMGKGKKTKKAGGTGAPGAGRGQGRGRGTAPPQAKSSVASATPSAPGAGAPGGGGGGRGRGGWGRGAFGGERQAPPRKGEKAVPSGPEDALLGLTFVLTGTLESLEREEAEELVKSHGGRVTGSVSKKTTYLLVDEDIGGKKSQKAKELGVPFLTEDGLFQMIQAKARAAAGAPVKQAVKLSAAPATATPPAAAGMKPSPAHGSGNVGTKRAASASVAQDSTAAAKSNSNKRAKALEPTTTTTSESWTHKYAPQCSDDIVGNPGLVKQLRDWLLSWQDNLRAAATRKQAGRAAASSSSSSWKRCVLLSGPPGIGKTSAARTVCAELALRAVEVNASDSRGKSDAKLAGGMAGKTANVIKEMVTSHALPSSSSPNSSSSSPSSVLIMDEVDGMSGGDRGGVSDLLATLRVTRVPIVCICNDRYARALQSLTQHCLLLNFRKPTKQQMAKRLRHIANMEKVDVADNVLEELCERVNGDIRMAINQLHYLSLTLTPHQRSLSYASMAARMAGSAKDEDLKPMAAVDQLLGPAAGRLRLDARLDAALSDIDLVPLMVQENYLNHTPALPPAPHGLTGPGSEGVFAMERAAMAADAIAYGDTVNTAVRRAQKWQLLPMAAIMYAVMPGAFIHGPRHTLNPGEMNFARFPAWLGKNSTAGKNRRLLEDLHAHMLASRLAEPSRLSVRLDYVPQLAHNLTAPLKEQQAKEVGVPAVLEFMQEYSLTLDDYDTVMALRKFKGFPDLTEGIPSAVKGQLTRDFKKGHHKVKCADLLPEVTGQRKGRGKKVSARLASAMEPTDMGDADVPVATDEGATLVEEEEDADADEEEDEESRRIAAALTGNCSTGTGGLKKGKGASGRGRGAIGSSNTAKGGKGRGRGRAK